MNKYKELCIVVWVSNSNKETTELSRVYQEGKLDLDEAIKMTRDKVSSKLAPYVWEDSNNPDDE